MKLSKSYIVAMAISVALALVGLVGMTIMLHIPAISGTGSYTLGQFGYWHMEQIVFGMTRTELLLDGLFLLAAGALTNVIVQSIRELRRLSRG